MFGSTEEIILPKAIEPVRKVKNLIENIPIYSLNKPIKHIDPIQRFKPPYIPAISE
jgi:ACT domain-containing protein